MNRISGFDTPFRMRNIVTRNHFLDDFGICALGNNRFSIFHQECRSLCNNLWQAGGCQKSWYRYNFCLMPWYVKEYNTPRFSDRHTDGGMKKKRYLCGKEENQNGKTIEIHSSIQGQGGRGSTQVNRTAGVAGQKTWRGTLENHGMEERAT